MDKFSTPLFEATAIQSLRIQFFLFEANRKFSIGYFQHQSFKNSGFCHSNFEICGNNSWWGSVVLGKKHFPLAFWTQKTFNLIADEIGEKNVWNIEIVQ